MEDSFKHKGLRKRLVDQIQSKGITDQRVLDAIGKIPRHIFMDAAFVEHAYIDKAFPIGANQTISQPYTVAVQSQLLDIKKGDKILEVGTGSGYQAAVLIEMGAKVYTIERQKELYVSSQNTLAKLGYKAQFFYGDGYVGLPSYGPFDKIIITAGAPAIPEKLLSQLKVGGLLIAPIGGRDVQVMTIVKKKDKNEYAKREIGNFVFVPMLPGTE